MPTGGFQNGTVSGRESLGKSEGGSDVAPTGKDFFQSGRVSGGSEVHFGREYI
eukprot:CAMPEP_0118641894 /NCGR_PEP_ID=MMETSP0785-20121206/5550_1 /TAXON_ID=91992 /ORGANISM="Bolidomonas pacifica, Strain CCMP 1866" /LENGTH=52 /DNA_ID=CAMNT_0006533419 /DNA_START=96 /DNA_END=254 /DNA_ORIENTATION=-